MWKFYLSNNTWEYMNGSQTVNSLSDYSVPFPGGVGGHSMVLDKANSIFYIFGGYDVAGNRLNQN